MNAHIVRLDPETLGDDLGERGLVSLARRRQPYGCVDGSAGLDLDPGRLVTGPRDTRRFVELRTIGCRLEDDADSQAAVPSVNSLLELPAVLDLIAEYGKPLVTDAVRMALAELRDLLAKQGEAALAETNEASVIARVKGRLSDLTEASLTRHRLFALA